MNNPRIAEENSQVLAGSRLGALALIAANALAMSGTSQVAWPGKPVAAQPDWPAGVLDLVNDPLRTEGWNPWFSEWPNDVNYYTFKVSDTSDVNRLIAKLAAIKSAKARVFLYPGKEPRALAFTTVLDEGNGAAVVFSIGSQERHEPVVSALEGREARRPGIRRRSTTTSRQPPSRRL